MGDLDVLILAVCIRGDLSAGAAGIIYDVSWISSGDRKQAWVHGAELQSSDRAEVGFVG